MNDLHTNSDISGLILHVVTGDRISALYKLNRCRNDRRVERGSCRTSSASHWRSDGDFSEIDRLSARGAETRPVDETIHCVRDKLGSRISCQHTSFDGPNAKNGSAIAARTGSIRRSSGVCWTKVTRLRPSPPAAICENAHMPGHWLTVWRGPDRDVTTGLCGGASL